MKGLIAVVLAAGQSRRLGYSKQLCRYEGQSLLARTVESLRHPAVEKVCVVTGWQREECWAEVEKLPRLHCVEMFNPDFLSGMGSSIALAARWVMREELGCEAILLCVCDQIALDGATIARLIDKAYGEGEWLLTASSYGEGRGGTPAIFPRSYGEQLASLVGDRGAKALLSAAQHIEFASGIYDVDTPEDILLYGMRPSL